MIIELNWIYTFELFCKCRRQGDQEKEQLKISPKAKLGVLGRKIQGEG